MNSRRGGPQVRLEAALDDPEDAPGRARVCAASERSAQRWVRSVASATTARGELGKTGWSKATAMSEPSASWTAIASSGREPVERAVEVAAERDAVLVDDPQVAERDDLEAARVGQDRAVPVHEPVQAAEPRDPLVARAAGTGGRCSPG